ncbi:MAG: hypothetical protein O7C65_08615, partial [Planctomycetota bacterium]|nr:hypothetical protein [Planctomycetota bacterium]
LSHTPIPQATRVIQETDPPRPSTISKRLKGNLEAIVLKALEKDRAKRFQSAADLVRNIRNHLAGKPIDIRPPTRFALAIHWLAHHPIVTTTAACLTIAGLTLAATSVSVWYFNARPHHIELTPDGREARLMSLGNNIIHTWRTESERGISFAQLVQRPPELGGRRLAIIGFSQRYTAAVSGSLCAYPANGDRTTPIWVRRIAENDLPTAAKDHGYKADAFSVKWCDVQDVFPGPKHPGLEVIADYQHGPGSACAVRIYDLNGELLYQIWHDGSLGRGYWMSEPGLLVLCGLNSEAYWAERGHPEVKEAHPIVLFALRPQLGHIATRMTTPSLGGNTATLAWYKCLMPPRSSDLFRNGEVTAPLPRHDPAYLVRFGATLATNPPAGRLSWVLEQTGAEVPGTRQTTDPWKLDPEAPDPDIFYLGDLPPIISTPE